MPIDYRDRLRRARLDRALDQRALATLTGLSVSTISAVERGERDLTAPKLFAWARACKISLDALADAEPAEPVTDPTQVALELEVSA